jgi:hypothetical protein
MTTTGDLLVEDAVGYAVRLAAGANNQVLTANGAGVKPTWQAAQGGSTKEFFVPVVYTSNGAYGVEDEYACVKMTAVGQNAYMTFHAPHDYSSITNAVIVIIPGCTQANANWDIYSNYAAVGQDSVTHSQNNTAATYNVASGIIYELDISGILTNLAAGDNVAIRLLQSGNGHNLNVLGIRFKYA